MGSPCHRRHHPSFDKVGIHCRLMGVFEQRGAKVLLKLQYFLKQLFGSCLCPCPCFEQRVKKLVPFLNQQNKPLAMYLQLSLPCPCPCPCPLKGPYFSSFPFEPQMVVVVCVFRCGSISSTYPCQSVRRSVIHSNFHSVSVKS